MINLSLFLKHKSITHLWRLDRLLLFCSPHPRATTDPELASPTTIGSPHGTHLGFLCCTCHHYRTSTFKFQIHDTVHKHCFQLYSEKSSLPRNNKHKLSSPVSKNSIQQSFMCKTNRAYRHHCSCLPMVT
jgi:hypothetical protein